MPRYDYKCRNGHVFVVTKPFSDESRLRPCEECLVELGDCVLADQQYSTFRFHLWKGWYENYNEEGDPPR